MATPVNELPNGTLILARAFTAQPLASRIGPRLRLRNFMNAISIDGRNHQHQTDENQRICQ